MRPKKLPRKREQKYERLWKELGRTPPGPIIEPGSARRDETSSPSTRGRSRAG